MAERDQSEFNMAVSYLHRLNYLFYLAMQYKQELNAQGWFYILIDLMRELSTEMNSKEVANFNETIRGISTEVSSSSRENMNKGIQGIPPELYFKLHNFEIKLRAILKSAGLQNKMKDDPRFAMR